MGYMPRPETGAFGQVRHEQRSTEPVCGYVVVRRMHDVTMQEHDSALTHGNTDAWVALFDNAFESIVIGILAECRDLQDLTHVQHGFALGPRQDDQCAVLSGDILKCEPGGDELIPFRANIVVVLMEGKPASTRTAEKILGLHAHRIALHQAADDRDHALVRHRVQELGSLAVRIHDGQQIA